MYSYAYLLDPKIANLVSAELQSNCIVVFDECHNIDNACIEAMSMSLNSKSLELASEALKKLQKKLQEEKELGSERLKQEYTKLVKSLTAKNGELGLNVRSETEMLMHPIM